MATVLASKHYSERPSFPSDLEVLLVDSSKQASETTRKALQGCSYRVTVCRTCAEAASMLSLKAIDLVLVEQKLFVGHVPGALQLRAASALVPTAILSDSGSAKDVWSAIAGRAADVLIRPLSKQKLQTLWQHTVRMQRNPARSPTTGCFEVPIPGATFVNIDCAAAGTRKEVGAPLAAPESKKRKVRETASSVATSHPPLSIAPTTMVTALPVHRAMPPPGAMMGYWPQPMMAPMMAHPHAWGTPVMGIPAGQHSAPALLPHPHLTLQMPHGLVQSVSTQPMGSQPMLIHTLPPARPVCALPAAPTAQKVEPIPIQKVGAESAPKEPMVKEPLSPTQSSGSMYAVSDNSSSGSQLNFMSGDQFISSETSNETTTQESQPSCDPTSLDDISEDDYAFIDFALSDDFPSVDDDVLPPLGLSLKKSSSLLNMLNVQMVY